MNNYLKKPFPFIENKKHRILLSFLFSIFIYFFLLIFQPFGIADIKSHMPIFISGFSGITLLVLIFSFLIAPTVFKNTFDFDKWTIKKNLIFITVQFLIISVLNWIYNSTIGAEISVQHNLMFFVFVTVSVGITPTVFLIYFIENELARKNRNIASDFTNNIQHRIKKNENTRIKLLSKNNDEHINIELLQLISIKSEGNYLKVFFTLDNELKSQLIRNSIKNIEEQLITFENIIRCHRSYIVNLDKVEKISGNARNFNLHIKELDFTIPVSRSFPKETFKKLGL